MYYRTIGITEEEIAKSNRREVAESNSNDSADAKDKPTSTADESSTSNDTRPDIPEGFAGQAPSGVVVIATVIIRFMILASWQEDERLDPSF